MKREHRAISQNSTAVLVSLSRLARGEGDLVSSHPHTGPACAGEGDLVSPHPTLSPLARGEGDLVSSHTRVRVGTRRALTSVSLLSRLLCRGRCAFSLEAC